MHVPNNIYHWIHIKYSIPVAANRKLLLHCFNIYCDGSGFNKGIGASALLYSGNRLTKVLHFHLGSEDKHTVYEAGTIVQSSYGQSKMACLMQTRGRVPFMQGENGKDGQEMLLISNCIGSRHILTSDPTKRQTKMPSTAVILNVWWGDLNLLSSHRYIYFGWDWFVTLCQAPLPPLHLTWL